MCLYLIPSVNGGHTLHHNWNRWEEEQHFNSFRKNKYQQNQKLSEGLYSCEYNVNLIFKVFDEN